MRFWAVVVVFCAVLGAWHYLPLPTPADLAPDEPIQEMLKPGEVKQWSKDLIIFHPLARYRIKARILSREPYFLDRPAAISNLDLALGWGRMSNPRVYDQLHISQGGRWYAYYWWHNPPLPAAEIADSSANTHIIPANFSIAEKMFWMREGDVVALSGYLVSATWPDGGSWTSSLSRTDTGDHACEVMWVDTADDVGR